MHCSRFLASFLILIIVLVAPILAQEEGAKKPLENPPKVPAQAEAPNESEEAGPTEKATPADDRTLPASWVETLKWRSIGPANMGGRITDLAVVEKDTTTWWAATASGGLIKTVNNGITFEHQFQTENVSSVGAVAVSQSNPDVVWVGTGEANPRNSVSWGDGVYKSTDGGKTWKHMGLEKSFQIGQLVIHPTNPDIVYVGALGRLWGPNEERGLYKTVDGGKNWEHVLQVDEDTGVVEMRMSPADPETLLVATYERRRDLYCTNDPSVKYGAETGLHKTADGGKTWKRITEGLPTVKLGRIGLDFYRKDPNIVYMVLESEEIGKGPKDAAFVGITGQDADAGAKLNSVTKDGPAEKAGLKKDDIILSIDGKTVLSYTEFLNEVGKRRVGDKLKIQFSRERKSQTAEIVCGKRPEPEAPREGQRRRRTPRRRFGGRLGGQRENIQEQQGDMGKDTGGVYRSEDGGDSWIRVNSCNPRPMYFSQIRVDPNDDNKIYVLGVSLYKSEDGGKKFTSDHAGRGVHVDHHTMWIDHDNSRHHILGNDGGVYVTYDRGKNWDHLNHVAIGQFYNVAVDSRRNYRVYGGLQDNGSWGGPSRVRSERGPINEDWIRVGGGDGFVCRVDANDPDQVYFESQNGGMGRIHLASGERGRIRPGGGRGRFGPGGARGRGQPGRAGAGRGRGEGRPRTPRYRFNWNTPFILSSHNSRIYYVAGNHVFRSLDKGRSLKRISPDITATKKGSATALGESPRDADLLYVGTDDGGFWVTRDGGHTWKDLFESQMPAPEVVAKADADGTNGNEERPAAATTEESPPRPKSEGEEEPRRGGRRGGSRGNFAARLLESDANGDGKIQRDEMPERMARMFGRMDANEDGVIDKAELKAMSERSGRRRGGRRGRPGGRQAQGDRPSQSGENAEPAATTAEKSEKPTPAGKAIHALLPGRRYVSHIEPSRYETGRCYVTFDGHRSDDDAPHLYVTEDSGDTWRSLRANLPEKAGSTRVIKEDPVRKNLLYLGTEFGAWVSIDRGESWTRLNANLPTVPVHDIAIHPTAGEIVGATHGRSLWVLDVTVLRQITEEIVAAPVTLFKPKEAIIWRSMPSRGNELRRFTGTNPPSGALIHFSLSRDPGEVGLEIQDAAGKTLRKLEVKAKAGLNAVTWDLRKPRPQRRGGRARRGGSGFRFRGRGRRVEPGQYTVVLTVDGETHSQPIQVAVDPDHPTGPWLNSQAVDEEEVQEGEGEEEIRNTGG